MHPVNFEDQNLVLGGGSTGAQDLPVHQDTKKGECISCWKMSLKERVKALFTGKVWLNVHFGGTQPPVLLTVDKPFKRAHRPSDDRFTY